jgi:hypothetical protein
MTDILIRSKRERIDHKFKENVIKDNPTEDPEELYCYWEGIHPKDIKSGDKVMFTDGVNVFAEGSIICENEWNGLEFTPLKEVSYPQPKVAPTRGFTYIR